MDTWKAKLLFRLKKIVKKIKAAIDAKKEKNPELVIGARTDARSVAASKKLYGELKLTRKLEQITYTWKLHNP